MDESASRSPTSRNGAASPPPRRVLVIDDDESFQKAVRFPLEAMGLQVLPVTRVDETWLDSLRRANDSGCEIAILDLCLRNPRIDGHAVFSVLHKRFPWLPVIFLSGVGTPTDATEAMKAGAFDYVEKGAEAPGKLRAALGMANRYWDAVGGNGNPSTAGSPGWFHGMLGRSRLMKQLFEDIRKLAPKKVPILIEGETGTGKELTARAIHEESGRKGNFVPVNCGSVSPQIAESELFGHVRGAFSGALQDHPGHFGLAEGGTLFLDEVAELSRGIQAKLLRAIGEGEVQRVGGRLPEKPDVRIIVATNRNLAEQVKKGLFRQDLFQRLQHFNFSLPALRDRQEDILPLAMHFLYKFGASATPRVVRLSEDAMERLLGYLWEGNVRELELVIEKAVIFSRDRVLDASDIRIPGAKDDEAGLDGCPPWQPKVGPVRYVTVVRTVMADLIGKALRACDENRRRAAKLIGVDEATIYRHLKERDTEGG